MKKFMYILLTGMILILCCIPSFAADTPWIQFIQAEDLKLDGSAVSVVDSADAIGGKALFCNEKVDDASGEGFTLTFTVDKSGDYTIWGRVFYPSVSNNSLYYSVDGGESTVWDFADEDAGALCYDSWQYFYLTYRLDGTYDDTSLYGSWTIENSQWRHASNILSLSKGEHTIHFTGREAEWYLDELVVTELAIEDYDPNYYEGNKYILDVCKFCGTEWKHFYKDIFDATGETAEHYFYNTLYKAEEVTEAAAEVPAVETEAAGETPSSPQTYDYGIAAAIFALLSVAGIAAVRRRKG